MSNFFSNLLPSSSVLLQPSTSSCLASVWRENVHNAVDSPIIQNVSLSEPAVSAGPSRKSATLIPKVCMKEVLLSELSPLGFHLNAAIKERIWKGEYIELISLLPSIKDNRLERKDGHKFEDNTLVPCNFNNFLQAFCIYASIMGERHPVCAVVYSNV